MPTLLKNTTHDNPEKPVLYKNCAQEVTGQTFSKDGTEKEK